MPQSRENNGEIRRALRALPSDIEEMYEGAEPSPISRHPEEYFGPSSFGKLDGAGIEGDISISWPNLAISMRNARDALRDTDGEDESAPT